MDLEHDQAPFGDVLRVLGRKAGLTIYVAEASFLDERLSVSLRDIPCDEALAVICRMMCKTDYRYPGGVFIDYACTSGDPGWRAVQQFGVRVGP